MEKSLERLSEIDEQIQRLERELTKLHEERRETINYLNLNKKD